MTLAETDITDGPAADCALAWHTHITADGSKTLTFRHLKANGISHFLSVIGFTSLLSLSCAIPREYSLFIHSE
jgi:hypothetical protein